MASVGRFLTEKPRLKVNARTAPPHDQPIHNF